MCLAGTAPAFFEVFMKRKIIFALQLTYFIPVLFIVAGMLWQFERFVNMLTFGLLDKIYYELIQTAIFGINIILDMISVFSS